MLERIFTDDFRKRGHLRSLFGENVIPQGAFNKRELFLFKSYITFLSIYQSTREHELHEDHRHFDILSKIPILNSFGLAANESARKAKNLISELDELQYLFSLKENEGDSTRDIRSLANLFSSLITRESVKVDNGIKYDELKAKCLVIFNNWDLRTNLIDSGIYS